MLYAHAASWTTLLTELSFVTFLDAVHCNVDAWNCYSARTGIINLCKNKRRRFIRIMYPCAEKQRSTRATTWVTSGLARMLISGTGGFGMR